MPPSHYRELKGHIMTISIYWLIAIGVGGLLLGGVAVAWFASRRPRIESHLEWMQAIDEYMTERDRLGKRRSYRIYWTVAEFRERTAKLRLVATPMGE